MNSRKSIALVIAFFGILVGFSLSGEILEWNPSNEILVVQTPAGGLHAYTSQGIKPQWFGTPTHYLKRDLYSFSSAKDQGTTTDQSINVQFAEGGTAKVSGTISWQMPTDIQSILKIHMLYGSQRAVDQQLVRPAVERSLYMTGSLITSSEAYSARKADFLRYFEDQVQNGIYQTQTIEQEQTDPITNQKKEVKVVQIVTNNNLPVRASQSPLSEFAITVLPPSIDAIDFNETVKRQIAEQQQAFTQVQTAQARALEAQQQTITVEEQGKAAAAQAKWNQEVEKAKAVTLAEQHRDVNKLEEEAAGYYKQQQILEGEGEAEKKRLIMSADGALAPKLDTYVKVQAMWADAFAKHQGPLVPSVVTGGTGATNGSNAGLQLMELLSIKAAKDLSLDFSVPEGTTTGAARAVKK